MYLVNLSIVVSVVSCFWRTFTDIFSVLSLSLVYTVTYIQTVFVSVTRINDSVWLTAVVKAMNAGYLIFYRAACNADAVL